MTLQEGNLNNPVVGNCCGREIWAGPTSPTSRQPRETSYMTGQRSVTCSCVA